MSSASSIAAADVFCPHCGYNLRGIESQICPECGKPFDRATLNISQIPWVHRKEIGHWRAFWRTVWMATFNIPQIAREMSRPVSLRDAQLFRLIVTMVAGIPLGALLTYASSSFTDLEPFGLVGAVAQGQGPRSPWVFDVVYPIASGLSLPVIVLPTLWLFFYLSTGVASYLFHPNSLPVVRQNRAVALSYYACGSLAWVPVLIACAGATTLSSRLNLLKHSDLELLLDALTVLFAVVAYVIPIFWWYGTTRMLAQTTSLDLGVALLKGGVVLLLWIIVAVITLGGIPWIVGFVYIVVDSLR